jgi:hypothetical protein
MKARLVLGLCALGAALALSACGGGSGSDGGTDPAAVAPTGSPVYVEAALRPKGDVKSNLEALAREVAGVDDLGGTIVEKLEESARGDGEPFDYEKEVEPWLGERAGVFFERYDGDDFQGYGVAVQTTDAAAAEDFVDKRASESDEPAEDGSYEGVDYKVDPEDGTTIGVVGELLVVAQDLQTFKDAVDASDGEALAEVDAFQSATSELPAERLADFYVDVGALVKQSGSSVDPQALRTFGAAGVDLSEATVSGSLVPGSDRAELEVTSPVTSPGNASAGNATELLESMPGDSFAALASPDFGKTIKRLVDLIDENGIEGEIPPHQLKKGLAQSGIDVERIAGSLGDLAVFVEGSSKSTLGGALVVTTDGSSEVSNFISTLGLLLRSSDDPGVRAIGGKAHGFSVSTPEIGRKPLVLLTDGDRIAIAYGLPAAKSGLESGGRTLADNAEFQEAKSALGDMAIGGFVDGPGALRLVKSLVPAGEAEFEEARPYLSKVSYVGIGGKTEGDRSNAKLIVGFAK